MKLVGLFLLATLVVFPTALQAAEQAGNTTTKNDIHKAVTQLEQSLVDIPAGSYYRGSTGETDEMPVHKVDIAPFKMMATEVTNAMWQACLDCTPCKELEPEEHCFCSLGRQLPISNVSYSDIVKTFIPWINKRTSKNYRLPTEAEWEYAARGGGNTSYSWGNEVGTNNAVCDGCRSPWDNKQPAPVKQFAANAFGLYDMHGNMDEWVQDCYLPDYKNAATKGVAQVEQCAFGRVLRGGSWASNSKHLRSSKRHFDSEDFRFSTYGFRLVLSD